MWTIFGARSARRCDGVSRRSFLQVGAAGIGGLTLADLYAADATRRREAPPKSIINIHLSGGPSHQDIFDLKPEAAREFRGEFSPITTNVPGIDICEYLPQLAMRAERYAIIRSVVGMLDDHSDFHTQTGHRRDDLKNVGGRPSIGSVVAKVMGPSGSGAPPFISYNGSYPGYLGPVYKPYMPKGGDLKLVSGMTAERLSSRTDLLAGLDRARRDMDHSGQMDALDSYTRRAAEVVTSGRVADALDLNKELAETRTRYGREGAMFLTARRLVEVGVRAVTFNWGGWDTHSDNFKTLRRQLPQLDQGLSALLDDLRDRGLDRDVTVVMWGEFGRTPRVNKTAGRDHWSRVTSCFLAGGGLRTGQVIGSTSRNAEEARERPVHLQEVFATLYHCLGIPVSSTQLLDPTGRPQFLVERREPVRELI